MQDVFVQQTGQIVKGQLFCKYKRRFAKVIYTVDWNS